MKPYLWIPPLFALITTLTSFGFIATVLATQVGEGSYISSTQVYAVVAICVVATLSSLGLLILVVFELLKKRVVPALDRLANTAVVAIGVVFCGVAACSFFITPTDLYEDFFLKFVHSARFEFLMIGVSALVMFGLRHISKESGKWNSLF